MLKIKLKVNPPRDATNTPEAYSQSSVTSSPTVKRLKLEADEDDDLNGTILKRHTITLPKQALVEAIFQIPDIELDACVKDSVSALFKEDYTFLPLKSDASARPLWVCQDGRIILEAFSPLHKQAEDFLITIAEPVSRPTHIQDYKLTPYSLYAAVAVGMDTKTILDVLNRFSKVTLPREIVSFIQDCTFSVKLVLKHSHFFIESGFPDVLRKLLNDEVIQAAHNAVKGTALIEQTTKISRDDTFGAVITLDAEDEVDDDQGDERDFIQSFEIDKQAVEEVKKRCSEIDYPLMEEYDFRNDTFNASLDIDLSPRCNIRDYQEKWQDLKL